MNLYISQLFSEPEYFLATALVVIFSICLHEYCHAAAALREGDDTAASLGHLTLNPFKQMGWLSLVMLAVIGIAWGCVPVNSAKFKHKYSDVAVSLAGPAANIVLWLAFGLAFAFGYHYSANELLINVLFFGSLINLALAFFNLLPIPGLDGGVLLRRIVPIHVLAEGEFVRGAFMVVIVLLFFGVKYLFIAADWATERYTFWLVNMLFG